jgi:hypothetical protein
VEGEVSSWALHSPWPPVGIGPSHQAAQHGRAVRCNGWQGSREGPLLTKMWLMTGLVNVAWLVAAVICFTGAASPAGCSLRVPRSQRRGRAAASPTSRVAATTSDCGARRG